MVASLTALASYLLLGGINLFLDNLSFFEFSDFFKSFNHADFLACNTLIDPRWVNFYSSLSPTIVGASNDRTGNIKYGGDWVMESTSEDIQAVYFSTDIQYYKFLLDLVNTTMGIKYDGTIWGTGENYMGQLGVGYSNSKIILTQITSDISGCTPQYIARGQYHTIVLMTNGTLWGTGWNVFGQLGTVDFSYTILTPMDTSMLINPTRIPKSISCGQYNTVVLMSDGTIWGTGYNANGQLGTGDTNNKSVLTQMNTNMLINPTRIPNLFLVEIVILWY